MLPSSVRLSISSRSKSVAPLEDRVVSALTGDHGEDRHLDAIDQTGGHQRPVQRQAAVRAQRHLGLLLRRATTSTASQLTRVASGQSRGLPVWSTPLSPACSSSCGPTSHPPQVLQCSWPASPRIPDRCWPRRPSAAPRCRWRGGGPPALDLACPSRRRNCRRGRSNICFPQRASMCSRETARLTVAGENSAPTPTEAIRGCGKWVLDSGKGLGKTIGSKSDSVRKRRADFEQIDILRAE